MPVMDGYAACIKMRDLFDEHNIPQPYIIALTGNVEESQIQKAWSSKFDELISKPASF